MQNLAVISASKEKAEILSVKSPGSNSLKKKSDSSFSSMLSEISSSKEKSSVQEKTSEKKSLSNEEVKSSENTKKTEEKTFEKKDSVSKTEENFKKESSSEDKALTNESSEAIENQSLVFFNQAFNSKNLSSDNEASFFQEGEDIVLSSSQLDFLNENTTSSSFDFLIENAEEYVASSKKEILLNNAQNLSVENPDKFLIVAEQVSENINASEISNQSLASLSLKDKSSKEEGSLLFSELTEESKGLQNKKEGVFTLFDNRSTEEKIAGIKENNLLKFEVSEKNSSSLDMTFNLNQNFANQNITSAVSQAAASDGSTFQHMLSQAIQYNAPEFVKAGNIVLKDNSNGSINMILKPESLGNVKVSLQLSDNVVTGQIVVATKEAYEAFKENLDTLKQAFQQSGFEDAQLNLTFSDNSQSGAFAGQQNPQEQMNQFYSSKAYSSLIPVEKDMPKDETSYHSSGLSKIDVVA